MQHPHFIDADGSFTLDRPEEISQLYFPLASEAGLKSCVSPDLVGDAKLDRETCRLEPVSVENRHTTVPPGISGWPVPTARPSR